MNETPDIKQKKKKKTYQLLNMNQLLQMRITLERRRWPTAAESESELFLERVPAVWQ